MNLTAEIQHYRVPEGAVIVAPKVCENCARDFYRRQGNRVLCAGCAQIADFDAQVWVCLRCSTERKWGNGPPEETSGKRLNCARCHDVTVHDFFEVSRGKYAQR